MDRRGWSERRQLASLRLFPFRRLLFPVWPERLPEPPPSARLSFTDVCNDRLHSYSTTSTGSKSS